MEDTNPKERLIESVSSNLSIKISHHEKSPPFKSPLQKKESSQEISRENIRLLLKVSLVQHLNIKCPLRFYGQRKNAHYDVAYAQCRDANCKQKFKFDIVKDERMTMTIFVYSTDYGEEQHCTDSRNYYQIRGEERTNVKEILKNMMPRNYQMEVIDRVDADLARIGTMQELRKLEVYQKTKSEVNCKYDLTLKSLEMQDFNQLWILQNQKSDPYFRYMGLPLSATMFLEETIKTIGTGKVFNFDGTGNCCS